MAYREDDLVNTAGQELAKLSQVRPRKRTDQACKECNKYHRKCERDKDATACKRCIQHGKECVFTKSLDITGMPMPAQAMDAQSMQAQGSAQQWQTAYYERQGAYANYPGHSHPQNAYAAQAAYQTEMVRRDSGIVRGGTPMQGRSVSYPVHPSQMNNQETMAWQAYMAQQQTTSGQIGQHQMMPVQAQQNAAYAQYYRQQNPYPSSSTPVPPQDWNEMGYDAEGYHQYSNNPNTFQGYEG